MSNFATIKAITDNLETVLRAKGIKFERKLSDENDNEGLKASQLPAGEIRYGPEDFEYAHGMKPKYVEVVFTVKILIRERNAKNNIMKVQEWVHNVREAINVNALNIGDLASSRFKPSLI